MANAGNRRSKTGYPTSLVRVAEVAENGIDINNVRQTGTRTWEEIFATQNDDPMSVTNKGIKTQTLQMPAR